MLVASTEERSCVWSWVAADSQERVRACEGSTDTRTGHYIGTRIELCGIVAVLAQVPNSKVFSCRKNDCSQSSHGLPGNGMCLCVCLCLCMCMCMCMCL